MNCPLCQSRLNIKIDGFTCAEAVGGAYLKGRVALICSDAKKKQCRYMHTTNFETSSEKTMAKIESVAAQLIRKLPDFGPWETFALAEREHRSRKVKS